jgi:hypothetical protein
VDLLLLVGHRRGCDDLDFWVAIWIRLVGCDLLLMVEICCALEVAGTPNCCGSPVWGVVIGLLSCWVFVAIWTD